MNRSGCRNVDEAAGCSDDQELETSWHRVTPRSHRGGQQRGLGGGVSRGRGRGAPRGWGQAAATPETRLWPEGAPGLGAGPPRRPSARPPALPTARPEPARRRPRPAGQAADKARGARGRPSRQGAAGTPRPPRAPHVPENLASLPPLPGARRRRPSASLD